MRFGKIIIGFLTVILLGLIFLAGTREQPAGNGESFLPFSAWVESDDQMEEILCWEESAGNYYIFLPGYAGMEQVSLSSNEGEITISGISSGNRFTCEKLEQDEPYSFSVMQDGNICSGTVTFVQSGGLPALYLNTVSGNLDYIHMEKGNEEPGTIRLYSSDGKQLYTGTLDSLKGRGNTSWGADKKPYNLTLSEPADLLGMGDAQRWCLLSEGYNSLNIRNKIVYDFAAEMGMPYSPDCEWVDLYLNGEYAGLYLLSERNEIHAQRIDISAQGSFVVSQEYESRLKEQKYPYVMTASGQALRIRYADSGAAELQRNWQSVENAVLAENGIDPVSEKHWSELIDRDSWVRKYLIEEVFGNLDAGSLSQYFYRDGSYPEARICAGPVWDYDFAMGGESVWLKPYTDYFTMNRIYVNEDVYTPWFPALYRQEEFYHRIAELFEQECLPLLQNLTDSRIRTYFDEITRSARMDGIRWGLEWADISGEPDYIGSFIKDRTEFLKDLWLNETPYHTVYVNPGRYGIFGCFAIKDGQTLPELPSAEDLNGLGWYNADTGEPFDVTQPIFADTRIYMKKAETTIPKIHFLPVLAVLMLLPAFFLYDRIQTKSGRVRNDPAKIL